MKRESLIAALLAACAFAAPSPALAEPVADAVTAAENLQLDAMANQLFAALRNGKTREGVDGFLGRSKLMAAKTQELVYLSSQIDGTIGIYGPLGNCALYAQSDRAGLVQQRTYICQHREYLTRWTLSFGKTSTGWTPTTLLFDDKISEGL